jgi:hypothetical protein
MYPISYKYQRFSQLNDENRAYGNFNSKADGDSIDRNQQCEASDNVIYTYTKQCSKVEIIHSFDAKHFIRKCMFQFQLLFFLKKTVS